MIVSHAEAGKCAAADPEGFAHSAAAGGAKSLDIKAKQAKGRQGGRGRQGREL